jgi:O-antigen ligase
VSVRKTTYVLVLALMFTIPWEQSIEYSGVGTISRVVGLAAAAAWFVSAAGAGRIRRLTSFHGAALAFVIWNGLTVFWSKDSHSSAIGSFTYVQLLVMLVILWDVIDTPQRVRAMLQAYVIGAFVATGTIIFNFVNGDTSVYERYSSSGSQTDLAALILALGGPGAVYLATRPTLERRSRVLRVLNYVYVPAATFAIVLTATRGAVIASIATAIFFIWAVLRGGPVQRVGAIGAIAVAVYLVVSFAPTTSLQRIATASSELRGRGNLNGRVDIWHASIDAFLRSPLLGVGHDAHRAAVPSGNVAHNTPLSILAETGLIGAVLFLAILLHVVAALRRQSGWDRRFWTAQLAVVAIGAMSLSIEDVKATWAFIALAVAAAAPHVATAPVRRRVVSTARAFAWSLSPGG